MRTISKFVKRWVRALIPGRCGTTPFPGSAGYWQQRYARGGNSGAGSYGELAEFKAEVLNQLVTQNQFQSVIEYGCGDGNQLSLANYPRYLGYDVSDQAIILCRKRFRGDATKRFESTENPSRETAELTLSLDVVYHLVEDHVFHQYMERLFDSAERMVVVYASNYDDAFEVSSQHVRHRQFTRWIAEHRPHWKLTQHVPNRYPYQGDNKHISFADFYVFEPAHV